MWISIFNIGKEIFIINYSQEICITLLSGKHRANFTGPVDRYIKILIVKTADLC